MTGIERLRELGREQEELSWSTAGKVRGRLMLNIADQIERETKPKHHTAKYVSVSAYDPPSQEDREAIAWVRKHGGLDAVRRRWECLSYYADPVPRSCMEKRLARLQRQIDESHAALRRRNRRIAELEHLLCKEMSYSLRRDAGCLAPKVPDADGEEIRVGDRVWSTQLDEPHEWIVIDPHGDRDDSQTVLVSIGDRTGHARPENLTHRAPVLAADGRPLREGEHVYHVETGAELVVKKLPKPGEYQAVIVFALPASPASHLTSFDPDRLTHERPESKCRDCAHWQKDPTADKMGVCWFFYHEHEGQDCYPARLGDIGACEEFMPRARALAERERGE